jgi:hypothetical protein
MNSNVCGTLISISAYNMKILTVNINGVYYCLIFNNDKISHIINNLNNNYFMVDSAMSIRSSISLNNYNNQPIGLVTMDVLNNQMELISILPNNILQNIGINDATILWGDVNVILNPTSFMRKAAKFKLNNMNTLRSVGNNIIKNYSFSYINGVNLTSISIDTLTINISFYKTDIMMDINLLNNNTNIHKVSFNADSLKHAGLLNASNPLQPLQLI